MVRRRTIDKFINHLRDLVNSGLSRTAYAIAHGMSAGYWAVTFTKMIDAFNNEELSVADFNIIVDLMTQVDSKATMTIAMKKLDKDNLNYTDAKQILDDAVALVEATNDMKPIKVIESNEESNVAAEAAYDEEAGDERNHIEFERDDTGKIKTYYCKVYIRDKEPLVARLTRDEMNLIYRLYSYYGQSITQREVSRYFPEWSLQDFKRILRVFSITKASAPFAPHMIEEYTTQELTEIQLREKENDFLRKLEAERVKNNEKLLTKYAQENADLKRQLKNGREMLADFDVSNLSPIQFSKKDLGNNEYTLFIWLSDMHIGAHVAQESLYNNTYNFNVAKARLAKVLKAVEGDYKEIVVCNIGDSIDGQDGMTVKRTHQLPQNMTNKEQVKAFINLMYSFIQSLATMTSKVSYYCVGDSNHDGILGYTANLALCQMLNAVEIDAVVFDSFIGHFKKGNTTYVLCHGKDGKDMFKNWPLALDVKTENYINEYLDYEGLTGNIVVIKGDLHQSATSYGRRFKYMSVGSLFGSSEWIHKNFGNTQAAVDFSIVDNYGMYDSRVVVQ